MQPEESRSQEPRETPVDAPMEGDEGAPEINRHADVGRAIVETLIRDVTTSPPVSLPADATVAKAIETMRKKRVGAVMVVAKKRPRKLVGILTERDLVQRVLVKKGYGRLALEKVMSASPESLKPKDSLAYALNKMSVGRFRHVPLVDERGVPVGMLSIRDVIDFVVELIPEHVLNLPPAPELEVHTKVEGE
jgi:CBS domain-containing protein